MRDCISEDMLKDKRKELTKVLATLRDYRKRLKRLKRIEIKENYYTKYLRLKCKEKELKDEIYFMTMYRDDD